MTGSMDINSISNKEVAEVNKGRVSKETTKKRMAIIPAAPTTKETMAE